MTRTYGILVVRQGKPRPLFVELNFGRCDGLIRTRKIVVVLHFSLLVVLLNDLQLKGKVLLMQHFRVFVFVLNVDSFQPFVSFRFLSVQFRHF